MGKFLYSPTSTAVVNNLGKTSAFTFDIPPGYAIQGVYIINNTANIITGGLKFGTSLAGTDVILAQAVIANSVIHTPEATLLKRRFSKTATQTIYVDAVTLWNSANVDIDVVLVKTI